MVPPPFFGSPPKAYYAHPALLGTWCQSLGSIGPVVSEKNGNIHTNIHTYKQTNIHFENRRPYRNRISNIPVEIENRIGGLIKQYEQCQYYLSNYLRLSLTVSASC